MSDFYAEDPNDPDAPVSVPEYQGIRPGDVVMYVGPMPLDDDPKRGFVVTEILRWQIDADIFESGQPEVHHIAVLDDGTWEVNADNLIKED